MYSTSCIINKPRTFPINDRLPNLEVLPEQNFDPVLHAIKDS